MKTCTAVMANPSFLVGTVPVPILNPIPQPSANAPLSFGAPPSKPKFRKRGRSAARPNRSQQPPQQRRRLSPPMLASRSRDQAVLGLCPDMCPDSERGERERRGDLDRYERLDGDRNQTSKHLAVKKYSRTAKREAELIRPMPVLQKTVDHLLGLLDQPYKDFLSIYNFLWDRMRAVRMDLRVQLISNHQAIVMLEQMIRLHIVAMHELCEHNKGEGFVEGFDAYLNIEQINKASAELFRMYDDHRKKGMGVSTEMEFRGYYALLKLDKHLGHKISHLYVTPAELSLDLAKMAPEIRRSPEILFAREVAGACRAGNYVAFFRLARKATYLQACLMHAHFAKIRMQALASLHSSLQNNRGIPLSDVMRWLGLVEGDAENLVEYHGFGLKKFEETYMIKEGPFLNGDTDFPTRLSNLVQLKKSQRISDICSAHRISDVGEKKETVFDGGTEKKKETVSNGGTEKKKETVSDGGIEKKKEKVSDGGTEKKETVFDGGTEIQTKASHPVQLNKSQRSIYEMFADLTISDAKETRETVDPIALVSHEDTLETAIKDVIPDHGASTVFGGIPPSKMPLEVQTAPFLNRDTNAQAAEVSFPCDTAVHAEKEEEMIGSEKDAFVGHGFLTNLEVNIIRDLAPVISEFNSAVTGPVLNTRTSGELENKEQLLEKEDEGMVESEKDTSADHEILAHPEVNIIRGTAPVSSVFHNAVTGLMLQTRASIELDKKEQLLMIQQRKQGADARLRQILRKWRQRTTKKKETRERRIKLANAALSSLIVGPPVRPCISSPRPAHSEISINYAAREMGWKQGKSWSTNNVPEVAAPVLSKKTAEISCNIKLAEQPEPSTSTAVLHGGYDARKTDNVCEHIKEDLKYDSLSSSRKVRSLESPSVQMDPKLSLLLERCTRLQDAIDRRLVIYFPEYYFPELRGNLSAGCAPGAVYRDCM